MLDGAPPAGPATEGTARTADGLDLFWRGWVGGSPRGALVIVHGLAEHSGRYRHVGRHFADRGWAAYALDTRAHGRSPGAKVHVRHFDEFLEDVRSMIALVGERHPGLPLFLLGHSQGGLVVLQHALRHPQGPAGIVVTSPFLDAHPALRPSKAFRLTLAVLLRVAPRLRLPSGVDPRRISRDPQVVKAYVEDPLVSRRVSPAWYAALRRAQAEVIGGAGRLGVPALVLASPDDRLADPEAVRRFAADAPAGRVDTSWWPGLSHELLNEPEREEVLAAIDAWLQARLQNTLIDR
jgi:acylglycerol lipase